MKMETNSMFTSSIIVMCEYLLNITQTMPSLKIKWQKNEVLKLTLKMAVFSAKSEREGTAAVDFSQIMCAKTRPHMGQS